MRAGRDEMKSIVTRRRAPGNLRQEIYALFDAVAWQRWLDMNGQQRMHRQIRSPLIDDQAEASKIPATLRPNATKNSLQP
jgi:hypothetical protein